MSFVLPGMRRITRVESKMAASTSALSTETLAALRIHDWDHGWAYPRRV